MSSDIQVTHEKLVYLIDGRLDRKIFFDRFKDHLERIAFSLKVKLKDWKIDNVNIDIHNFYVDEHYNQTFVWLNVSVCLINVKDENAIMKDIIRKHIINYLRTFFNNKKTSSNRLLKYIE